ncbi:MAG: DUF4127 family protein [Clostridia bacterium]|nr:DUF4127 family protein [Clostridia bacterium]
MKKIVYLPLDERPCNYSFAAFLSEQNPDFCLVRPEQGLLGEKKRPAEFDGVAAFLKRECAGAYALVLSVDMLLYGGIVPSRLHQSTEDELLSRLSLLETLKKENPALKIYAFALIMRCPSYSSSDEEPDYYETCGKEIFLRGQAEHKYALGLIDEADYAQTVAALDEKIGGHLADFLNRRKTNLSALKKAISYVGNIIDKFVIPQDDSSPYGYTAIDQQSVKEYLQNENKQVDIYPGADEVGMTLLAAAVNGLKGGAPKICPVYPCEDCKKVVPLYEDREVQRSVAAQIKNAGCILAECEADADILLFCNLPVGKMKNISEKGGEQYEKRNLPAFTQKMKEAIESGKRVAAADIAYCNGGDEEWARLIEAELGMFSLCGYAGWNTSSNTLGTAICQSVLHYYYGDTQTHRAFTAERIYEDIGYCAFVRKYVCDEVLPKIDGLDYFHADGKNGEVARLVKSLLHNYVAEKFPNIAKAYEIETCEMPWSRMFEVGLTVKEK